MRIIFLGTWIANIGNAFIDKGALASLKKALPDAEIYEVSGYPNFLFEKNNPGVEYYLHQPSLFLKNIPKIYLRKLKNESIYIDNCLNVGELIDADIAVLAGCTLYEHVIYKYASTLLKLKKKGIKIMLLGAGGGDYEKETQRYVKSFLKEINPIGIITRDSLAYKHYSECCKKSYDGIDCGFFINEWYKPPKINDNYIASTFDSIKEPNYDQSKKIIRLHHRPFHPKEEYFKKSNTIISDNPKDYLTIYANANETHSDRIHACVASLAYNVPSRLYYSSPRDLLFEKLTNFDITKKLTKIDASKFKEYKNKQISKIKEIACEI